MSALSRFVPPTAVPRLERAHVPAVALLAGLRAATATVVPIVLAALLRQPLLIWAALGGWLTSLADAGGAYRTRARSMAAFIVGGALTCAVASLAGGHRTLALVLIAVWAGMGGLMRVGGDAGAALGTMFAATFVAALATPAADAREAWLRAALLAAGGLSAMVLALVVWPVRPYAPVRESATAAVHALSALARGLRDAFHAAVRAPHDAHAPTDPRTPFGTLARTRHAPVRAALEEARVTLAQTRRTRLATSRAAEDLAILLEQIDELFAALVGAEGAVEAVSHAPEVDDTVREAIATVLRRLPEALDGLAASIATSRRSGKRPAGLPALDGAVVALWQLVDPLPGATPARPLGERVGHAAALLEQVATLVDATSDTVAAMLAGNDDSDAARPSRAWAPMDVLRRAASTVASGVRMLAHPDLVTRRHAARLALTVAAAQLLGGTFHVARAQWMTTTVLLVLQPYAGATWQRGAARVGGTVLGGVVAAVLAAVVRDQLALAAAMFVLAVAAVAVRRIDYALFTFFLTPLFVLLAEPALGDWRLAGVRIVDTVTGGVLAVLASRLLWPTFESQGIPTTLGVLMDRVRESFDAAARSAGLLPEIAGGATHARARRRMGLAANMADAALERWLAEPRVQRHDAEALLTMLAEVRRVGVACTGLAALPPHVGAPPAALAERAVAIDAMLADLADAVRTGRAPAPADQSVVASAAGASRRTAEHHVVSAAAGPLSRVARHVLGLHGAAARLVVAESDARDAA
ncbi:FUSC family protein [Roseisolibacter agri]|uniref:Integral membrane bound transporter domain-containing protein n=1 Tax=Roseisolibacter agri TaxID=2014610 RepID=A0AA37V8J5_9BACT|nr:FUSC family protein [Roseisolibacter agri]GLC27851.1 hypothetical protein rosag_43640 [Roseisolibacter agri]